MLNSKFHNNIKIIDHHSQQFQLFLNQVKINKPSPPITHNKFQQHFDKDQLSDNSSIPNTKYKFQHNPQDLYQNKSQFKFKSNNIQHSHISHFTSSQQFDIRKIQKSNTNQTKFQQQDNIKNQHPGQLIILKSAHQLPSWLFQQIRKQNVNRLKNVSLKQDQIRHSQFNISKDESEVDNSFVKNNNIKSNIGQRYLNQSSYFQKIDKDNRKSLNNKQKMRRQFKEQKQYRKTPSSHEIPHFTHTTSFQKPKKLQRNQQIYINDYEYSYCPEYEIQEKSKRNSSGIKNKHQIVGQRDSKKAYSLQKVKRNQYRIRQDDRAKHTQNHSKIQRKRLPTVSQQQPLVQPKKYILC